MKVAFFDIDGVLIHTPNNEYDWRQDMPSPQALKLYTELEAGGPLWEDCLKGNISVRDALFQKAQKDKINDETVLHVLRVWHGRNTLCNHEMLHALQKLKEQGWYIGIASNQDKARAHILKTILQLDDIVNFWGFSCFFGHMKPEAPFYKTLLEFCPNAQDILFVDDKDENLTAPRKLGWHTHRYTTLKDFKDFLELHAPT